MDGEIVAFGGGSQGLVPGGEGYAALPVLAVIARKGDEPWRAPASQRVLLPRRQIT